MFIFRIPLLFTTAILSSALRTSKDDQMDKLSARVDAIENKVDETQKTMLARLDKVEELVKSSAIQLPGKVTSSHYQCEYVRDPTRYSGDQIKIKLRKGITSIDIQELDDILSVQDTRGNTGHVYGHINVHLDGDKTYNPLNDLPDIVKEEIKTLNPQNTDDCRRLFILIAQHPLPGYQPGIEWLWSFFKNTLKKLEEVRH